jgi:hypothetical protein
LVVSREDWPAAIRVLDVKEKILSTSEALERLSPECEH